MINSIGFLTYLMREGRDQVSISLCEGRIPLKLVSELPKRYVTNHAWSVITILLHFSFWLFNILYKYINRQRYLEYKNYENQMPAYMNKENLFMFAKNAIAITFIFITYSIALPNNFKHPRELEKYPTYVTIYFEHCISQNLTYFLATFIFFTKNKRVRSEAWQEIKAKFESFR